MQRMCSHSKAAPLGLIHNLTARSLLECCCKTGGEVSLAKSCCCCMRGTSACAVLKYVLGKGNKMMHDAGSRRGPAGQSGSTVLGTSLASWHRLPYRCRPPHAETNTHQANGHAADCICGEEALFIQNQTSVREQ